MHWILPRPCTQAPPHTEMRMGRSLGTRLLDTCADTCVYFVNTNLSGGGQYLQKSIISACEYLTSIQKIKFIRSLYTESSSGDM